MASPTTPRRPASMPAHVLDWSIDIDRLHGTVKMEATIMRDGRPDHRSDFLHTWDYPAELWEAEQRGTGDEAAEAAMRYVLDHLYFGGWEHPDTGFVADTVADIASPPNTEEG